ncbi:hypothetical protein [uncultured Roseobacter sp.]|uniref:hypothetical protein n=1 Tax=uncultured Roseobacter sp. TaxID=114847 RepID=UPI00262120B4|nr:hypothetical protein [uncultured Roseobacter sp.]
MDDATGSGEDFAYDMYAELFGALNEAPEKDQARILKTFLIGNIDTMREHTVFQLDLIEKLASIALNNVQDVRLHSLEARVRGIEQGEPVTFGQIMGELFFALAVEVTLLAGVTGAAPVLAGASALLLTSIKTSARSKVMMRRIATLPGRKAAVLDRMRSELVGQEVRLLNRLHMRGPPKSRKRAWRKRQKLNLVTKEELARVRHDIEYLDQNRGFVIEAMESDLPTIDALAVRYQDITERKINNKIRGLIDDYAHHIDAGKSEFRAFSQVALQRYPEAFPAEAVAERYGTSNERSFTTTGAIVELTTECESLKLDVIEHYAQMRAILEAVEDDDVFSSFETVLVMEEIESNLFDLIDLSDTILADLDAFVIPMELAVWLLYLEANDVLEREQTPSRKSVRVGGYSPAETRFIDDNFVDRILSSTTGLTDSPNTLYEGRQYPGLRLLDEHQAYYLFHRFAKPAFDQISERVPVSATKELSDFIHRDVAEGAFDNALSLEKVFFWSGENERRRDLINEMRVVVIEYFNIVREKVERRETVGFSQAVPEGSMIGQLLGSIEKPMLPEVPSQEEQPKLAAQDILLELDTAQLMAWEERTLAMLDNLDTAYERALEFLAHNQAMKEKYKEDFPETTFNDLFLSQAEAQLLSTRTAIEGQIGMIQTDRKHSSSKVDNRADALMRKLMQSPVKKEMFSTFEH